MGPHDLDPLDSQSAIVEGPLAGAVSPPAAGAEPAEGAGLVLEGLEAGTAIVVATRHSSYRFVIVDAAQRQATVLGGKMFPERTDVRIEGATTGANVIKPGKIVVGLRLELSMGLKRITTSSVTSVSVEKAPTVT
ncbi:MAG TPA: hypothetical protein VH436_14710 [Vicinamibacterales bacterium]|jgi:hypothetical protein